MTMANASVLRLRLRNVHVQSGSPSALLTATLARVTQAVRVLWCTMNGGHFRVLHTEPSRIALRCVACGHTTPGWDIGTTRPIPRYAGDPERFRIGRAQPRTAS